MPHKFIKFNFPPGLLEFYNQGGDKQIKGINRFVGRFTVNSRNSNNKNESNTKHSEKYNDNNSSNKHSGKY